MSGLLVYPFCDEFAEFARCQEILAKYDRLLLVAPKSHGLEGEDASICDGGDWLDIVISSDFASGVKQADAVFFGYAAEILPERGYLEKIRIALEHGKKVYITRNLREYLGAFDGSEQVEVLGYTQEIPEEELTEKLLPIPLPVIMVLGIGDHCNNFSIQLKLREHFQQQGYRVLGCGSKEYSGLFGVEALPQFLFDDRSGGMKIRRFNSYLYHRVAKEKPDVVIIDIPGGIMQINPYKFSEFGETAFLISNAVKSDLNILSLYKQEYTQEFLEHLIQICKYRFNFQVNYINIANTNFNISPEDKLERYTTIPSRHITEEVLRELRYEDVIFFNALNADSRKEAYDKILSELEDNI